MGNKDFKCQGCGHELESKMCMRTPNYCYLCDPNITVDELLSDKEIKPMEALSIKQPWASLIAQGIKDIENTIENKKLFFAQYFGQNIIKDLNYPEHPPFPVNCSMLTCIDSVVSRFYLELRDVKDITDEEALHFLLTEQEILGYKGFEVLKVRNNNGFISIDFRFISDKANNSDGYSYCGTGIAISKTTEFTLYQADYLRSKSFLVPYMDLPPNDLIQIGWAKLKQSNAKQANE